MDCKWGSWSQWSSCSKTCGNGVEQRNRERATKAKNGGKKCTGGDTERRSCTKGKCFKGMYKECCSRTYCTILVNT